MCISVIWWLVIDRRSSNIYQIRRHIKCISYSVIKGWYQVIFTHKWNAAKLLRVYVTVCLWDHDSLNGMRKSKAFFCCCDVTLTLWSNTQHVVTHTKNLEPRASSSSSAHFLYSSSTHFYFSVHILTLLCEMSILRLRVHWKKETVEKKQRYASRLVFKG